MAEEGVLQMPVRMVDPVHRHVVALESNMQVVAYNKEVISKEKVPETLEDFLKPEFKGRNSVWMFVPKLSPPWYRFGAWKRCWISHGS